MRRFPLDARQVRSLEHPSKSAVTRAMASGGPVLMRGGISHWPLFQELRRIRTDAERLRFWEDSWPDGPLRFSMVPRVGPMPLPGAHRKRVVEGSFADFAAEVRRYWRTPRGDELPYMQSVNLAGRATIRDLMGGSVADGIPLNDAAIWIGGGGQRVNLHFDRAVNFMCLLSGVKRVALLPHEALPLLYPAPLDLGLGGTPASCVRLLGPDHASFPRARVAFRKLHLAVVRPGDVLMIPPGWWHHVESFGFNVMVNSWINDIDYDMHDHLYGTFLDAMALFQDMTEGDRARQGTVVSEQLFRARPGRRRASRRLHPDAAGLIERLEPALARIPPRWRRDLATDYDYFVFQRHGTPLAHLGDGQHARMIARLQVARANAPRTERGLWRSGWGR